jgi:hypothetical protein
MATIKLKSKASGTGAPTTLNKAEPAFDLEAKRLYTASDNSNTIIETGVNPSQLDCSGTVDFTGATSVKSFVSHTLKDNHSIDTDPSAVEIRPIDGLLFLTTYLDDLSGKDPAGPTGGDGRNTLTFTYKPTFMGEFEGEGNWKSDIMHIWNYRDNYPDAGGALLSVKSPSRGINQPFSDPLAKGGPTVSLVSTSGLSRDDGFSTNKNAGQIVIDSCVGFDQESLINLQGDSVLLNGGVGYSNSGPVNVSGSLSLQDWQYFTATLNILNLTGNTTIDCAAFAATYTNTIRIRIVRNGHTLSFSNIGEWIGGAPTFNANVHYIEIQRYFNLMTARQLGTA